MQTINSILKHIIDNAINEDDIDIAIAFKNFKLSELYRKIRH
jgi:hypothetical protein